MLGELVGVEDLENNNNPTRKDEKRPKFDEKKIAKWPKSNEILAIFSKILARSRFEFLSFKRRRSDTRPTDLYFWKMKSIADC